MEKGIAMSLSAKFIGNYESNSTGKYNKQWLLLNNKNSIFQFKLV